MGMCEIAVPVKQAATFDPAAFRSILRSAAAAVTVITTREGGSAHGMTATAFSSVSAEPPTILVVLNRSTRTHPKVAAAGRFVVNILTEEQEWLGQRFAGKLDDQFEGVDTFETEHRIPVLDGALAHLECVTVRTMDVGTHTIFVGEVVNGSASQAEPLLYHDGRFKVLAELPVA